MAKKYLRGLQYTTGTNGRDIPIFMRVCYEFWAYCVNNNPILTVSGATNATPIVITTSAAHGLATGQIVGISGVLGNTAANGQFAITVTGANTFSLTSSVGNGVYSSGGLITVPGGMPATPLSGPAGFFEGTTTGTTTGQTAATSVVLAVGTDGITSDLGINFTSLSGNFNTNMIGKHITIWSHTDVNSTDNSIYRIINVVGSTQLQLAPFSGGTKDITTLKNNLTSRSALNYRIVDFVAASQLAVASGNYFVGTLSGASTINAGQASSQFQFLLRGSSTPFGQFGMVGSPAGTWNGSTFTGSNITERVTATATNFSFTTAGVIGNITLIADKDFFIGHIRSPNSNGTGYYFYVLVPQRLYTQAQDPNLLTILVGANNLTSAVGNDSHSTAFAMLGADNVTRTCQLMTKNFTGDGTANQNGNGAQYTLGPNLTVLISVISSKSKIIYGEAIISNIAAAGQYALARARMRPIAFTNIILPNFHLVGDNGEFIHVGNGVLWPWDGSILPYNLLPLGT